MSNNETLTVTQPVNKPGFFRLAKRCAIIFGAVHLLALICFAVVIGQTAGEDAQWQMVWMLFWLVDFPISNLMFAVDWPSFQIPFLPYPFDSFRSFVFPCLFFGILGTLWYAFVGCLFGSIIEGLIRLTTARRAKRDRPGFA